MKKINLLNRLEQLRLLAEDAESHDAIKFEIIDVLLEYIGNPEIRKKVDEIPCA